MRESTGYQNLCPPEITLKRALHPDFIFPTSMRRTGLCFFVVRCLQQGFGCPPAVILSLRYKNIKIFSLRVELQPYPKRLSPDLHALQPHGFLGSGSDRLNRTAASRSRKMNATVNGSASADMPPTCVVKIYSHAPNNEQVA